MRKLARFNRNDSYYSTIYFSYRNILYKGIFFSNYTDNVTPLFFFQLNSYDLNGNIIDVIVLDKRVYVDGNEVLYFDDLTIQQNGEILVSKHEQYLLDYELNNSQDEGLGKGGAKYKIITYQMSNFGIFKKIKNQLSTI